MSETLFISDLHLAPERPQMMELFIGFTKDVAAKADSLFILGDFLEVWWGDDDPAEAYQGVFNALRELDTVHGTKVYMMHGNRDFMMGQVLAKRCHYSLIDEPYPIKLAGKSAMLIHGDSLCTDDIEYQKFRAMVRNPLWQQQVLTKTLEERFALAKSIRDQSKSDTSLKDEVIMDVNDAATRQLFIDNKIELLIHGHTHRPAFHELVIDGKTVQRIVLGDWYEKGNYLRIAADDSIKMLDYAG